MKQLKGIESANFSTNGLAVVFGMQFADGKVEKMAVAREDMPDLIRALLQFCHAWGERSPTTRPLSATTPADTVHAPAEELHSMPQANGAVWLVFRVGSIDLSFALPSPTAAKELARSLLAASP